MKYIYIGFFVALLFGGCHKDKGNYDYTTLEALKIDVPFENYEVGVDSKLTITPEIATQLDEADLLYQWEVGGFFKSVSAYYAFVKFAEGKKLDYTFKLTELMPGPGTYRIRLHALQKSTGRSFYSSTVTIALKSDYSGLMVLHGDDSQSDIGLLKATDFLVSQGQIETKVIPDLYSSVNKAKIPGKGVSIIQSYTYILNNVNKATVVAITDNGAVWAKYADFSKGGDWNSMFNSGINKGVPQFYTTQDQSVYAVDNGQIFPRSNNTYSIFPIASPAVTDYNAGSPFFEVSGRAQGFFFDKTTKGFVATTNKSAFSSFSSSAIGSFKQIQTNTYFNLANMNAELVYMDKGGQGGHFMAVMKETNGNKYLAELNWAASADKDIPAARYDMSVLPDINNARVYAFGDNQAAMCYYATPSKVYRFTALPGNDLTGRFNNLRMEDGTAINLDGEITMMRILKPLKNTSGSLQVNYYNYNKIMLIGVYKAGKGTLYSLKLNETTGDVISFKTFEGFNKIFDANIKGL